MFSYNKNLLVLILFLCIFFNSCNLLNKSKDFDKANNAIYTLYTYYNNNKSLNKVTLNYDEYGKFSSLVKLEKKYLEDRQNKNNSIDEKSEDLKNLKIKTEDSIDEYNNLVDIIIKTIENNYNFETKSNSKLISDIKNLNIDKKYLNLYISNTKKRIDFEKNNMKKINEKNIEILEKSKELMNLYKSNNFDNSKAQNLKNELNNLNNEYNNLVKNFNNDINDIMDSIYNYEN